MDDVLQHNDSSRRRLEQTLERLTDADLHVPLDGGWTVSAALAHLAFWDRLLVARWRAALDAGAQMPIDVPTPLAHLINDAALDDWLGRPPREAVDSARDAARGIDELVTGLDPSVRAGVVADGRPRLIDRSFHRNEHLDAIERHLGTGAEDAARG